ncbi:MAG: hypothetical protein QOJ89_1705 [bacterium]
MSSRPDRWRPRRAGIINLYEYADQTFDFAGGRLLLRGHNTSGKTKALELLFPFCLDGDIRPQRLDPFASTAKDMKWNLVGSGEREQRVGYVWLEFERIAASGETETVVAGIGLRASRTLPEVTRWHFVARNRVVGGDLALLRGRDPLSKADLAAALGDDGEVLDSQRDYRTRLNDLLYGFSGHEQYQTMLRLMRELRRPHLSKTLDPDGVAEQLSAGLPEIDTVLMGRLAGGLEQLETLERGLARLRDVRERVRRFHARTYAAYTRAVLRERADALRQAQTAVESASERLRETQAQLAAERGREQTAVDARDAADADVARLDAEERAVHGSSAWASIAELDALGAQAAAQRNAADRAQELSESVAGTATMLEAEAIAAAAAAADERRHADAQLDEALDVAGRAGLTRRASTLIGQLRATSLTPSGFAELLADLARDWRDVLHRHRELLTTARGAHHAAQRARAAERDAAEQLARSSDRQALCEQGLEEARAGSAAALDQWRADAAELVADDATFAAAHELLAAGRAPGEAMTGAANAARDALARTRADVEAGRRAREQAVATVTAEIDRLDGARDDGPAAPTWSRAPREGRAGAALWQLVDFAEHLDESRRAGIEAALEASGLLDAWLTPDGFLADPSLADVLLVAGPAVAGRTLADVLVPVPDQPVTPVAVERVLRHVGLGPTDAPTWVDVDGRFAIGALTGCGAKERAEHVGAAAREARRQRRIAVLRAEVDELTAALALDDVALAQLDTRRQALACELAELPIADAVAAAIGAVRISVALREGAERDHERAVTEARAAAAEELATDAARREHAVEHSLPAHQEAATLDELGEATAQLLGSVPGLRRAWERADAQAAAVTTAQARVTEAQRRAAETDHATSDERAEADRLTAEHQAREAVLGHSARELRARHAAVAVELRAARKSARDEGARAQSTAIEVARLEHDAQANEHEADARRRAREVAATGLSALAAAGILGLVLGDATPPDVGNAHHWSTTRALEVARALPAELLAVRSSAGALAVEVQRGIALLDRELAEADMRAHGSQTADGVLLVQVGDGVREQPLSAVLTELDSEIAERERVLTAQERRVFSDALVEEIAEHLRHRIHEVRTRVEHMNAVLRRSPTAAGKVVELDWTPAEHEDDTQRAALALLRRGMRNLGEGAREELVAFFRARVARARTEHTDGAPKPLADTLAAAFDYRRWFSFGLYERTDEGRVRLTKRRHAIGSGGEQSVLIHLPLFAAAAALYGDSNAPRLIMLDEALSGIDDDTRERVLAATVAFDLDVVMTSHELWGTYRSVPQLSIYQLHRENGEFGVHALPFLWDGDVLYELEQGELLV